MNGTVIVAAPADFVATVAATVVGIIQRVTEGGNACSIALCGGSTPAPVYQALALLPLPWAELDIFFGDERAVAPDSSDSNYAMAARTLFTRVPLAPARIHRMAAERRDADAAAREYEHQLPAQLDLLLLGVGPDGHTASLFPGAPSTGERTRRVLAVASPSPPLQPQVSRMTITAPVIAAAKQIVTMVRGAEKADIMRRILEGPDQPTLLPAQLARRGIWLLDQPAAAQLQRRDS
jgi:6-phosphogluconolactonase